MKIKRDKRNQILNVEGKVADAREQLARCLPVVLFIMLYKVVLTFESVDDILRCDYSNETSCSRGPIHLVCSSSYNANTINFRIV